VTVTGNKIHATKTTFPTNTGLVGLMGAASVPAPVEIVDRNAYYDEEGNQGFAYHSKQNPPEPGYPTGGGMLRWSSWRSFGMDPNSTWVAGRPTENWVMVQPNLYEQGRAHVAVFDWARTGSVSVDPASIGLARGQGYEIRLAQGFHTGPIAARIVGAGPIVIPFGIFPTPPVGSPWSGSELATPDFQTFVIVPTTAPRSPIAVAVEEIRVLLDTIEAEDAR